MNDEIDLIPENAPREKQSSGLRLADPLSVSVAKIADALTRIADVLEEKNA